MRTQANFLSEPELEFGSGVRHVDIRYGLMRGGPLDKSAAGPKIIRLGVVGTSDTIDGVCQWLERCATNGVHAKKSRLTNLFPLFPGFSASSPFSAEIRFETSAIRTLSPQKVEAIAKQSEYQAIADMTQLFFEEMSVAEEVARPDVTIVALPEAALRLESDEDEEEEETDLADNAEQAEMKLNFRQMLKAKAMSLQAPIQIVLPTTFGQKLKAKAKAAKKSDARPLQDEATRAWNFFTALYYKAQGIPWRIARDTSDLQTCFIGVSFYQNMAADSLMTSMAQVFNERGEGIIVRGAAVAMAKRDRQPHLSENDAYDLVRGAIKAFRDFHKHSPARIALHKSSSYTKEELAGFQRAISDERIEICDLLWIDKSSIRLFRNGNYPPLRGTMLKLEENDHLLYTRGSVEFFRTYPGLYVPRPLRIRSEASATTATSLASEIMALTKLNWNKTQFDGSEPITLHAARRVGAILKYVPDSQIPKPRYSFYM